MARPSLEKNVKFKALTRMLGLPKPYVRGLLETMWDVANECGNAILGDQAHVEAAAEWPGTPGQLFQALKELRFIDEREDGAWEIHDYWDHAPEYVKGRLRKEQQRKRGGGDPSSWTARRVRVLERDGYLCAYCGGKASTVDHVTPKAMGGDDDFGNLVGCCEACNYRKNNRTPEQAGMAFREGFTVSRDMRHRVTQKSDTPAPAPAPAPFSGEVSPETPLAADKPPPRGKRSETLGTRSNRHRPPEPTADTSDTPPSARKRNDLFDAVVEVTASDPKASGSHIGRVCRCLRAADPPYTPAEVRALPPILQARGFSLPLSLGTVEKYIGWVRRQQPDGKDGPVRDRAEAVKRQREKDEAMERAIEEDKRCPQRTG